MKTRCIVALSCALVASAALADKLYLKSGSVLIGKAGSATTSELVFVSDDLGEVNVKLENIVRLEDAGSHVVRYSDNTRETIDFAIADGVWTADSKPFDMSNVKEIDPGEETWHGSINGAFNATRGNTVENSWSVMANITRRWEKDRFNALFGYYYSEKGTADTDMERSTDRWEAEAQHDHFWLPKVYTYENLRYDRDMIQALEARYRVGLGAGYQWLDKTLFETTGWWSFNQDLGVSWIKEEYKEHNDDVKHDGFAALRYAHHLSWIPKWNDGLEAFHNLEILPDVGDWEKFLAKTDVGFTTKLIYNLDLLAKIEWEFNSCPAGIRKKGDVRYIVGLGYKW